MIAPIDPDSVPFGRGDGGSLFSHFTRGARRGEASGKYLAFEPRISFPDASPLPSATPLPSPLPSPTPIPTINIAIAILQNNNPGPVWPARQVYAVFPFYAWAA